MIIGKHFEFEAAHQLPDEECYGACRRLHGHTYKLTVEVYGNINEKGWVMNFKDMKAIIKERIVDKYDHQFLNDFFPLSTAEVMVQAFWNDLLPLLPLKSITLYETSTCYARIEG